MKKTRKVISMILSVFMLMQMMTGVVLASEGGKLGAPTNIKLVYDEDYEEYMYKFTSQIPSGVSDYEYGLCVGGNVDGRVILSNPTEYSARNMMLMKHLNSGKIIWEFPTARCLSDFV